MSAIETFMSDELKQLLDGGEAALADAFSEHRDRLGRMVKFRLDRRLRGRIDPDDVLQDAYIEIARRIQDYLAAPNVSFYVWIRQITWQTLIDCHRVQMGLKRDPKQEVRLGRRSCNNATTFSIAQALLGNLTSPSAAAIRQEEIDGLYVALDGMDEIDREVLALRHFEHLENGEVAEVLGLSRTAASNRYVRALTRLGKTLSSLSGFKDAF
jgi:RNA polymerase sigma-70 factor (ECF subfamily)